MHHKENTMASIVDDTPWTIPVIDLSNLSSDFYLKGTQGDIPKSLLTTLRKACEQVGFFRIVNHGIPETLIENLDSAARSFFAETKEVKERAASSLLYRGYVAGGKDPVSPTPESLIFSDVQRSSSIPDICDKLWPQGNPEFRETVESYAGKMIELSNLVLKLCLCCFEVDLGRYMSTFENKCEGWLNMNNYSPDGVQRIYRAHTDKSWITILHQDEVGGLQVLTPQGKWAPVEYEKGSLVVNVGDIFQMWSNRRYRSSEHRVIYGGQKTRQSFAFFYLFQLDMEIRVADELVDEKHPEYYKPTVFIEFEKHGRDHGLASLGPPEAFVKHT